MNSSSILAKDFLSDTSKTRITKTFSVIEIAVSLVASPGVSVMSS